ncbi:EamA family transporter [Desulfovibrio ferrophilus]|uniref:EamA-like transporter family n=1 Tax=Desulfovibrio ferrophilus TaxID=241368 RepID=A0A2Z6AVW6_9BACT|nr:EamA family transporter [Desulfovibrio ferrophilus]BBD07399.1 EamA-like transporter family [Desulfovibrio ferrophilus]
MKARDLVLALVVAVVWGFTFVVIEVGLESFPPLLFSALRFFAAAVPAVFFVRRGNVPWSVIVSVGLVFGAGYFGLLFVGMERGVPAGLSSLVVQIQAAFTAILAAALLKDPPVAAQKLGMTIAFAGIGLIAWEFVGESSALGLSLVLASAFVWALSNIILKRAGSIDMFRLMVWMSLVPILPLLGMSALFESGQMEALASLDVKGIGAVLYVGYGATVFGFGVWGDLFKRYPPNVVAPFSLLVPIFGMTFSWLLLGEQFTLLKLGASLLVFIGLATNVLGRMRHDAACAHRQSCR